MMRALGKEWVGKYAGKKDYAAVLGNGFAAGVGIYNNIRMEHERGAAKMPQRDAQARASIVQACTQSALAVMAERLKEMENLGLVLDDADGYLDKLPARCTKAVTNYVVSDPMPDTWQVVGVEHAFGPEYGNSRPDVVVKDDTGLAIVDYKSKLQLRAEYRQKTLNEYANSHQMLHYGWAGQEIFGEPVHKYYIGLAVIEPRWAFDFVPYPIHPETLETWLTASKRVWELMEAEEGENGAVPWMSANHSDNFGQCPYYKACFVHHYDPDLMKQDYLHVERVKQ